jgi:hypothetical protein
MRALTFDLGSEYIQSITLLHRMQISLLLFLVNNLFVFNQKMNSKDKNKYFIISVLLIQLDNLN